MDVKWVEMFLLNPARDFIFYKWAAKMFTFSNREFHSMKTQLDLVLTACHFGGKDFIHFEVRAIQIF